MLSRCGNKKPVFEKEWKHLYQILFFTYEVKHTKLSEQEKISILAK